MHRWFLAVLLLGLTMSVLAVDSMSPSQITIASTAGATETRTLIFSADADLTGVQIYTQDLLSEDGTRIIPASQIIVTAPSAALAANSRTQLLVTVQLANAESGRYTGEVVLHHDTGDLIVPLTITVKHSWIGAVIVLALGLVFGMWAAFYRQNGLPRDDLLIKKLAVTQGLSAEKDDLLPRLRQKIEANLYDTDRALDAHEWDKARAALNEATRLWNLWGSQRGAWIQQMAEYTRLSQYLESIQIPLPQMLRHQLEILEAETPQALYDRLATLRDQIALGVLLSQKVEALNLTRQATGDETLRAKVQQLEQALTRLNLNDAQAVAAFQAQIEEATPVTESTNDRSPDQPQPPLLNKWPSLSPTQAPYLRRSLFWTITYIGVWVTLFVTGYQQLYQANPVFGANVVIDYVALFLFGFTGEVALAAFTRANSETAG